MMNCIYRGLKVFLYYLSVLSLCRLIFCLVLHEYWGPDTGWQDLLQTLWLGSRLSIQTAGILALFTAVPAGLINILSPFWSRRVESLLSGIVLTITSILFVASFPYYGQFHSRFHQLLFNAGNDDMYALFVSLVQEFNLPLRLAGALLLAFCLWRGLKYFLAWRDTNPRSTYSLYTKPSRGKSITKGIAMALVLYVLGRLIVFGGSWGWETALEWENVGVTKDSFMNEAILDDYQAIYRGYRMNNRMLACNGLNFTAEQIQQLAGELAGRSADSNNLDDYLRREAQGFQHFYGRGDMPEEAEGSVWGCDDEYLYAQVLQGVSPDTSSFNVILNVSNHSPYTVDVAAKGFDADKLRQALPPEAAKDDWLVNELGHYWYADRELAGFVKNLKEKYPDCLVLIVGDHADRYNIDKQPSMYERYVVPFVVTGAGVHKGTLLPDSAGSQIDIGPTIIEMVAPKGFAYYAIGSSLTRSNRQGVNYGFWITRDFMGEADRIPLEPVQIEGSQGRPINEPALQHYIDAVRSISWWRPKYGPVLDEALLKDR